VGTQLQAEPEVEVLSVQTIGSVKLMQELLTVAVPMLTQVDHRRDEWFYKEEMPEAEKVEAAIAALREWNLPVPSEAELERCPRGLLTIG
jgi:hypothetical protein